MATMVRFVLCGYWAVCNLTVTVFLLAYASKSTFSHLLVFRELTEYGKLTISPSSTSRKTNQNLLFRLPRVPKRWFRHFYASGIVYCIVILGALTRDIWLNKGGVSTQECTRLLALMLLLVQVMRRFLETSFVSVFSDSTMSLAHYVLGITFYLSTALTVATGSWNTDKEVTKLSAKDYCFRDLCWYQFAGVVLFIWASYHQYKTACILANLRRVSSEKHKYAIPQGDWFQYVSCPHYLQEILIYLGLLLVLGARDWMQFCQLFFVVTNQTLCAIQSHHWYANVMSRLPAKYCIIPWLL